jgi:hypothetical protein
MRQRKLSAAMRAQSTAKARQEASKTPGASRPRETTSISAFKPYWVKTEQTTAAMTAPRMMAWPSRCRPT